jgi:two-component system response regulator GlrR
VPLTLVQRALRSSSVEVLLLAEARQRFERDLVVCSAHRWHVADAARLADNRTEFYRLMQNTN